MRNREKLEKRAIEEKAKSMPKKKQVIELEKELVDEPENKNLEDKIKRYSEY